MQVVHACLNCKGSHAGLYCSILSAQALCVLQAAADSGPVPKREVGQITGTNSDLRRLSMEKSREILISLGITDDEIKGASCNGVRGSETTFPQCRVCRCMFAQMGEMSARLCLLRAPKHGDCQQPTSDVGRAEKERLQESMHASLFRDVCDGVQGSRGGTA